MTKYVLEVLDGPQQGTILAIDATAPVTIGRKPSNVLALEDEKCSGAHAEVVHEDGGYVLRDLQSRNGTVLGGARVQEIVLSPFDVFQVGKTQIAFRDESQSMPTGDLSIATLDASALARRGGKKGLPLGAILVGLLLLGGGGAWAWLEFGGGGSGGAGSRSAQDRLPERVDGNRIAVGVDNFEGEDGWILSGLERAGFEVVAGRSVAHTGEAAIEAVHRAGDEDAPAESLAMARLAEPLTVNSDSKLRVRAMVRTSGNARAALRLAFESAEDGARLTAGTDLTACDDGWQELQFEVGVPRGMDRAEVQLLAMVPDEDSWARVDDVAVVVDSAAAVEPIQLTTDNGRMLAGVGADLRITTGDAVVLEGMRPLTDDPLLNQLDRERELVPSDAGVACAVTQKDESGFRVEITSLGRAKGLVLDFPVGSAGVLTRGQPDAPFTMQSTEFQDDAVTEALLGSGSARCILMFDEPVAMQGLSGRDGYAIHLPNIASGFDVRVRFEDEAKRARELLRVAERERRQGHFAAALDAVRSIVEDVPHASDVLRDAGVLRVAMLSDIGEKAEALRRDGATASFFDARNGYRRVADGVSDLIEQYGEQHIPQLATLQTLRERAEAGMAALDQADAQRHAVELRDLAEAFGDAGREGLTAAIKDYLKREHTAAEGGN